MTSQSVPGAGGALTTSIAYNPGARTVTTTLPGTATSIETRNIDGRMVSITGTSAVNQHFTHSVESSPAGHRLTQIHFGANTSSPRWTKSWTDWLDRPAKTERPGYTGESNVVEQNTYEAVTGRLTKSTRTGYAPTLYVYDEYRAYRSGLDVNEDDSLDLASNDRITDSLQFFEYTSSAWWLTKQTKTYPTASSSTSLTTSTVRTRMTGFVTNQQAETVSIDVFGNTTTQNSTINTGTKTLTVSTTTSGISNTQSQTIVNGLPKTSAGFDGVTTTIGYDPMHRPSTSTDASSRVTTTSYYSNSPVVYRVQDPASNYVVTYTYDAAGRVASVTDAGSGVAYTTYNDRNQVYRQWGHTVMPVEYTYDSTYGDRVGQKTFRAGTGWTGSTWPGSPGTADWTRWVYDGPSGLLKEKYDAANLNTGSLDANGVPNPISSSPKKVSLTYNVRGQTARLTLARGLYTDYTYSSVTGELTDQDHFLANSDPDTATPNVSYTYNRAGLPATTEDGSGTRTFAYDSTYPIELDTVTYGSTNLFGSRVVTYLQDGYHRPDGVQVGSEILNEFTFESATGRIDTVVATPNGQSARTFDYSYNANGLVSGYTSGTNQLAVSRAYETNRNLLTAIDSQWNGTSRAKFEYSWDSRQRPDYSKMSGTAFEDFKNTSNVVKPVYYDHTFDDRGQLTRSTGYMDSISGGNELPWRDWQYAYDTAGNRTQVDNAGGGSTQTNTFTANALNQYSARQNNGLIFSGTAAHGSNVLVEGRPSVAPREGTFWADMLSVSNSSAPWTGTGRVYAQTSTTTVRTETRTVSLPQAAQSFTYDDDGNLTADGVWTYTYDAENRLIAMETASGAVSAGYAKKKHEFKYDAGGRRVEKKTSDWVSSAWSVTSTYRYLYDGWNLIGEYSWNGSALSLVRSYTWGLDLIGSLDASGGVGALLQMRDHSGSATYLATYDGNGNVAALLNASDGSVAASYEYSPFGELLRKAGAFASANPFRFSTKFTDDESSLSYYGMRYYSASLGRFLNRDPIAETGGLNLYGFASNNPISLWDKLGMMFPSMPAGVNLFGPKADQDVIKLPPIQVKASDQTGLWETFVNWILGYGDPAGVIATDIIDPRHKERIEELLKEGKSVEEAVEEAATPDRVDHAKSAVNTTGIGAAASGANIPAPESGGRDIIPVAMITEPRHVLTLASMGKGRTFGVETGKHSWLELRTIHGDGTIKIQTFGTYGNQNGKQRAIGLNYDTELNGQAYQPTARRVTELSASQLKIFNDYISAAADAGSSYDAKSNNCVDFAAGGWALVTGERLRTIEHIFPLGYVSTPRTLANSIAAANGGTPAGVLKSNAQAVTY